MSQRQTCLASIKKPGHVTHSHIFCVNKKIYISTDNFPISAWLHKAQDWSKKNLKPNLKKISQGTWKIIANLLTPKRWSIKGGLETGLLGLANVYLEITFGS